VVIAGDRQVDQSAPWHRHRPSPFSPRSYHPLRPPSTDYACPFLRLAGGEGWLEEVEGGGDEGGDGGLEGGFGIGEIIGCVERWWRYA